MKIYWYIPIIHILYITYVIYIYNIEINFKQFFNNISNWRKMIISTDWSAFKISYWGPYVSYVLSFYVYFTLSLQLNIFMDTFRSVCCFTYQLTISDIRKVINFKTLLSCLFELWLGNPQLWLMKRDYWLSLNSTLSLQSSFI